MLGEFSSGDECCKSSAFAWSAPGASCTSYWAVEQYMLSPHTTTFVVAPLLLLTPLGSGPGLAVRSARGRSPDVGPG